MTLKCSTTKLPYGGGKGGICANPKELSLSELERVWRCYAFEYTKRGFITPMTDVGAPDMNSGPREMAWITDVYRQLNGDNDINAYGVVTGKPLELGGVNGRTEATGLGMFYVTRELLNDPYLLKKAGLSKGIKGKTCIVQGFGNVATWFSKFFYEAGGIVTGVVDWNGSVWDENGLDINKLIAWQDKTGSPKGFKGAKTYDDDRVLYYKCDVHGPSAMEQQIHIGNVHKIQAKVIVEGANGPITPQAHAKLVKQGVLIIPDMLANSGGVTVSYFEWLKNLSHVEMGMLTRRWEQQTNRTLLDIVQRVTGSKISPSKKEGGYL